MNTTALWYFNTDSWINITCWELPEFWGADLQHPFVENKNWISKLKMGSTIHRPLQDDARMLDITKRWTWESRFRENILLMVYPICWLHHLSIKLPNNITCVYGNTTSSLFQVLRSLGHKRWQSHIQVLAVATHHGVATDHPGITCPFGGEPP